MKKLFAVSFAFALILNLTISPLADSASSKIKRVKANQLVAMLPDSDGVMTVDIKRFFDEAAPMLFAADKNLFGEVAAKIEQANIAAGIDLRRFEYMAVGVLLSKVSEKDVDPKPVMIARGEVDTAELIAAAKKTAGGKFKEEHLAGKTMYIFASNDLFDKGSTDDQTAAADAVTAKRAHLGGEVAIAAIDGATIVFGDPMRVRQTVEGNSGLGGEITALLNRKSFGIVNFAAKLPTGMGAFVPLDNDDLGKNIDSIQHVFGNMDVENQQTSFSLTARTQQNQQAEELKQTLEVLQIMGKMLLGGSKRTDQQLYARLIEKVKLSRNANEVSIDLALMQSDIEELLAVLKK